LLNGRFQKFWTESFRFFWKSPRGRQTTQSGQNDCYFHELLAVPFEIFESLIHFLPFAGVNVLCGVGILSTPYAVRQGGWLGLVILSVLAVLAWYTGVLLRRCLDSKEGIETYPDIGQAAFGTPGRIVISVTFFQI
jgi:hypothetical protein